MATIKDIAEKAGVTVTTVSRVLNNRGYISEVTRNKVFKAMEELNYQPNELARSLAKRRSNLIGLIVPTIAHPFFGELTFYLESFAYKEGYKVMVCNSQLEAKKEKEYIDMLRANQVDGIVMASHTLDVEGFQYVDLPIVTFDRQINGEIPYVSSDNYYGGTLATNLLIDKGCRQIAYIGGNLSLNLLANKRHEAFVNSARGRHVSHVVMQTDLNGLEISQYDALVHRLFSEYPDVDGIFASSDLIAAAVLKVCRTLGRRVPEDLRLVGYDDLNIASLVSPGITTIRQPIAAMAKLAMDLILRQIGKQEVPIANILPVELVMRETV